MEFLPWVIKGLETLVRIAPESWDLIDRIRKEETITDEDIENVRMRVTERSGRIQNA